ncbi:MAG: NTP transferase domain-containing protein [Patescibacteria group bacterium]|nr:NTP transferase domain-containing protein [Patescibacteria group bacterium]
MATRIIILAAGNSTRMNGVPKMLLEIRGKPMLQCVVDAAVTSGVDVKPVVVVGKNEKMIRAMLGDRCEYVIQEQQLGTGHAVQCAVNTLRDTVNAVAVLYGDNPLVASGTIRRLVEAHVQSVSAITMLTTAIPDFEDWRKPFYDFGRIVRDAQGKIERSVEKKDASPEELDIKELNPSFYCFNAVWLRDHLPKIEQHNAQHECYLTDLVQMAIAEGSKFETIPVSPKEAIGVNTAEQLEIVRKLSEEK